MCECELCQICSTHRTPRLTVVCLNNGPTEFDRGLIIFLDLSHYIMTNHYIFGLGE